MRLHLDENTAAFMVEEWLQSHAGGHPTVFFNLYRLLRTHKDLSARRDVRRNAHGPSSSRSGAGSPGRTVADTHPGLDTKAQRRRTLLGDKGSISVDQALKDYISFYETSEKYRDAFVLGRFEEVTEDFGQVMKRLNEKFGTTFSVFRHDEENVSKLFAGMEAHARKKYDETLWVRKVQRPAAIRERIKDEIQYDLESPKRKKFIARADAVYNRLTNPMREPAPRE